MGFRMLKRVRGLTLTERVIVVAIVGIVVAVALPSFLGPLGATSSGDTELNVVQTAVDAKMAATGATTTAAITTATSDMTGDAGGFGLAPAYMRATSTKGTYTVDTTGKVTQVTRGF